MNDFRRTRALPALVLSVTLAVGGCGLVGSALMKLAVYVGKIAIDAGIGYVMEKTLDACFTSLTGKSFRGADLRQGGQDVEPNTGDPTRGHYNGTLVLQVQENDGKTTRTFPVHRPAMIRSSASADDWRLDPSALKEAREKFGGVRLGS